MEYVHPSACLLVFDVEMLIVSVSQIVSVFP